MSNYKLSIRHVTVCEVQLNVLEVAVQIDYATMLSLDELLLDVIELMLFVAHLIFCRTNKKVIVQD